MKNNIRLKHKDIKCRILCIKHLEILANENLVDIEIETAVFIVLIYKNDDIKSLYSSFNNIKKISYVVVLKRSKGFGFLTASNWKPGGSSSSDGCRNSHRLES